MIAYKLLRVRKDGTIGPLFINCKQRIPIGEWLDAEFHPRKGYKARQGWHCCPEKNAPHLSEKGRQWFKVEVDDIEALQKPEAQGGTWVIAQRMKVLEKCS